MSKPFFDSNIVLYANDDRDPRKKGIALKLVTEAVRHGLAVVSTQVLAEYASIAIHRMKQDPSAVTTQLQQLELLEVIPMTSALMRRGIELHQLYQVHFWDGCILAAAEHANCRILLSEDLNPGQRYGSVKVENPFA